MLRNVQLDDPSKELLALKGVFQMAMDGKIKIIRWSKSHFSMPMASGIDTKEGVELTRQYTRTRRDYIFNLLSKLDKRKIMVKEQRDLIQQLLACAIACEECASACLQEDDVQMMAQCIRLDRDCADMCIHVARLVVRQSDVLSANLAACEAICRMCAEECSKHDDDHCKRCAEACFACAEACEQYHEVS